MCQDSTLCEAGKNSLPSWRKLCYNAINGAISQSKIIKTRLYIKEVFLCHKQRSYKNISYWFPVGSSETTTIGGVTYASGEPMSTNITSSFGNQEAFRTSKHGGIDIGNGGNDTQDFLRFFP